MDYTWEKQKLDDMIGKKVTLYHAEDFEEDGAYTEIKTVVTGYRLDEQFGVADIFFKDSKALEIMLDDVFVNNDSIDGEDVSGLYFVVDAAA